MKNVTAPLTASGRDRIPILGIGTGDKMAIKEEQKTTAIARLNRMEGQIRGIRKMLEDDRKCEDVLLQVAAVKGAMNSLSIQIAEAFIRGCIAVRPGNDIDDDTVEQLLILFKKFQC